MTTIREAVEAAEKIDGWMNEAELTWLAEKASEKSQIVEMGCFKGRSTKALALSTAGTVIAVDFWVGDMRTQIYPEFCRNLAYEIATHKVIVHRGFTAELARQWVYSLRPDMVFIDADHSYEAVTEDIAAAMALLQPGGLLCGHDFSNDYPGVQRAVAELVPHFRRVPGGDIWWKEIH